MLSTIVAFLIACNGVSADTYTVPASPPSGASPQLDPAPVGISFEFSTFPERMTNVSATQKCLQNLGQAMGTMPPLRIGGLTQDRGTYVASSQSAITYTVSTPKDNPGSLTFGPEYINIAAAYTGQVVMGFNRKSNNKANTVAASLAAYKTMKNLYAIELGNEPDDFGSSSPVATDHSWTSADDAASEVSWQAAVGTSLGTTTIIQAGAFSSPEYWTIAELAGREGTSMQYVRSFSDHGYPQTNCGGATMNLPNLMSHSIIVSWVKARFPPQYASAKAVGKPYVIGETNSATCSGGALSPTFGAALWIIDYVMQALIVGTKNLNFHQATIDNCRYCWWSRETIESPFYGGYFAAEAIGGADNVAMLDTGKTAYAAYAIYKANKLVRIVLYNSDYYTSGTRSTHGFTLNGLPGSSVTAKRLTAPSALSEGHTPTFGGQVFTDGTCEIANELVLENKTLSSGSGTFQVSASEALLIFLD